MVVMATHEKLRSSSSVGIRATNVPSHGDRPVENPMPPVSSINSDLWKGLVNLFPLHPFITACSWPMDRVVGDLFARTPRVSSFTSVLLSTMRPSRYSILGSGLSTSLSCKYFCNGVYMKNIQTRTFYSFVPSKYSDTDPQLAGRSQYTFSFFIPKKGRPNHPQ